MTDITDRCACVFGGTGFIGRQIVRELARAGYRVKVPTRAPERAYFLKTAGHVGQIVPVACRTGGEADVRAAVRGCDVVVNCIGILYEKGASSFTKIHTEFPRALAKACAAEKVGRLIHLSAMGCEESYSKYGKSKRNGELAIFENFPKATILRPSVVFGPEDNFFNMFARIGVVMPVFPLIGGGHTKFQPVYVGDVAAAVRAVIEKPDTAGRIYELGGPDIVTFREVYARLSKETGRKFCLMPLPWGLASLQGRIMGMMPAPLLTADQVESLKTDNITSPEALTLADLGLEATPMDVVLPTYLARYRPGGRFGDKKRA